MRLETAAINRCSCAQYAECHKHHSVRSALITTVGIFYHTSVLSFQTSSCSVPATLTHEATMQSPKAYEVASYLIQNERGVTVAEFAYGCGGIAPEDAHERASDYMKEYADGSTLWHNTGTELVLLTKRVSASSHGATYALPSQRTGVPSTEVTTAVH